MAVVVGVVLVFLVASTDGALANDHKPPRAWLLAGENWQRDYRYDWGWWNDVDGACYATFGVNHNTFQRGVAYQGRKVSIRLAKASLPAEMEVVAWRKARRKRRPAGEPKSIPHTFAPHIVRGVVVAWDVVVVLPERFRHLYIQASGFWRDEQGCHDFAPDLGSQYVISRFHVKRRPARVN